MKILCSLNFLTDDQWGEIASAMRSIAIAEKQLEKRHLALLKKIESKKVFKRDGGGDASRGGLL